MDLSHLFYTFPPTMMNNMYLLNCKLLSFTPLYPSFLHLLTLINIPTSYLRRYSPLFLYRYRPHCSDTAPRTSDGRAEL